MSQPLSDAELDEVRMLAEAFRKASPNTTLRLLATIEVRDREAKNLQACIEGDYATIVRLQRENAALEAKLANIRKLCNSAYDLADCAALTGKPA
jgi:hypothetical protein